MPSPTRCYWWKCFQIVPIAYDRGKKFEYYGLLPSLREYILVDQFEPKVEVFSRENDLPANWQYHRETGLKANMPLQTLGCILPLKEIYHLGTFPPSLEAQAEEAQEKKDSPKKH